MEEATQERETAQERQMGHIKPRAIEASALPPDPVWAEACREYARLKAGGMPRKAAAAVFTPLLRDAERASAARMMLDSAGA